MKNVIRWPIFVTGIIAPPLMHIFYINSGTGFSPYSLFSIKQANHLYLY